MTLVSTTLVVVLSLYQLVLFAYVILAWVPRPPEPIMPFVRLVRGAVDPVLAPLRRVLPPLRLGGAAIDLSILVLFVLVRILIALAGALG